MRCGEPVWRDGDGYLHTWDSLHGEVERFSKLGYHLGALDPITGRMISGPVKGRKLEL
ncbi:MAG: colicin E3/pyocin S6 family cytotoxin [Hyphomicrobiales bacterium]